MTDPTAPQSAQPVRDVGQWFQQMPLTRTHWVAGLALFMAFVIESWEMMIIIFSSGAIGAEFELSTAQIGSLIGAMFLGMIPGALLWGKLSGSLGRKRCMVWSIGLYGLFPLLSAFAPSFEFLWAVRFICGIVLAGALVVTFPYFEELVPVNVRGKATVYLSAGWPLGVLVAIAITTLFMDMGWRWVIGFGTLVSLWGIVLHKVVPESPYWLAEKGRPDEAVASINRLAEHQLVKNTVSTPQSSEESIKFTSIFKAGLMRTTVIQTVINFCFSWGYWGLATWMPTLLAKRGLSAPEGLGFMALSALFMFPGYISASYLTGRFGRKKVMLVYVFMSAVAGFGFANSGTVNQMYAWNFVLSFFSLGAWGVWNTWLGEIYNTRSRGAGVAWGVMAQRVANAAAPVVIGALLVTKSFLFTVGFISAFLTVTFVAATFLPETEGHTLD
ncbi:MAG: MFS transporter [Gammaproteobacteria bacterium]